MNERDVRSALPGSLLLRVAQRLCSRHTYEAVIVPTVADLQHECANRTRGRAWVYLRGYVALVRALVACCVTWPARHVRSAWLCPDAAGPQVFRSLLPRVGLPLAVLVALNLVASLRALTPATVVLWIPAMIVGLAPMAMFIGVALTARRLSGLHRAVLGPVIALSLASSLAMFLCCGWIVPSASSAWRARQQAAQAGERRPAEEWTTPFGRLSAATLESRANGHTQQAVRHAVEWHLMLAMPIGCTVLALLGLAIARRPRPPRPASLALAGLAIGILHYALTRLGEQLVESRAMPTPAIWLPNAFFLMLAFCILASGRSKVLGEQQPEVAP